MRLRSIYHLQLLLVAFAATVNAAADPLSIKDAFKPASFASMRISPDGKQAAAIAHVNHATALVLVDTATLAAKTISGPSVGMRMPLAAHWVNNELLAVDFPGGVDIINTSGKYVRTVGSRYIRNLHPDDSGNERVLAHRLQSSFYIDRVDVRTGTATLTNFDMPGRPIRWVFDEDGIPRVVTTMSTAFWSDESKITHWYRTSIKDGWQKLATFSITEDYWTPVYLTRDGKSLAIYGHQGRDTAAYFRYDLGEHRIAEVLAGHPTQDIYARRGEADEDYDFVLTHGMKPEIYWFDSRWASLQRSVDAVIPGRINLLSGDPKNKVLVLVYSYGDVDPGQWYVLDTAEMLLRKIATAKPEIDPGQMRPMEIVNYPSTDGMTIPAYLTLPKNTTGSMPAVVLIHGGPTARDEWRRDPEAQFLASRGYVVLQPQFRGSSGFGKRFMEAGYGQWGLGMQDDVSAGARWLAEQGIADPNRICVYGASYGGYAAMWGLIKAPNLFEVGCQ